MATRVLSPYNRDAMLNNCLIRSSDRLDRRHYKKDTRFLLDLYTLTYDNHESVDSLGDFANRRCESLNIHNLSHHGSKNNVNNKNSGKHVSNNRFRRPSLQIRMQDGKNMQLCYVNEPPIDIEDNYIEDGIFSLPNLTELPMESTTNESSCHLYVSQSGFSDDNNNLESLKLQPNHNNINWNTPLRQNVRASLKNVSEETRRQLELENRRRSDSPITRTIKTSLKKVGAESGNPYAGRQRMNRHMLTKMNSDQLQVIINDLHLHVEDLNEQLMKMLMERDELHMKRDSLLVDIEDLKTYLNAKHVSSNHEVKLNLLKQTYIKNNPRDTLPNSCNKNLISGLRFNRITSYIKN